MNDIVMDKDAVKRIVLAIASSSEEAKSRRTEEDEKIGELISGIEAFLKYEPTISKMRFLTGHTWWYRKPIYEPIKVHAGWVRWAAPNFYLIQVNFGETSDNYDFTGGQIRAEIDLNAQCTVYACRDMKYRPFEPERRDPNKFAWGGILVQNTSSVGEVVESIAKELALFCER